MVVSVGLRKHMGRDRRVAGLQGDDACREQMRDEPGGEALGCGTVFSQRERKSPEGALQGRLGSPESCMEMY